MGVDMTAASSGYRMHDDYHVGQNAPRLHRGSDIWLATVVGAVAVLVAFSSLSSLDHTATNARTGLLLQLGFIAAGLILVRGFSGRIHPASAIALVTYSQMVLYVARPLYQIVYSDTLNAFSLSPYSGAAVTTQLITGAGYFATCMGFAFATRRSKTTFPSQLIRVPSVKEFEWRTRFVLLAVLAGTLLYSVYILQTGPSQFVAGLISGRSDENRAATASSSAYFYLGLQVAFGALLYLYLLARLTRNTKQQSVYLTAVAIALVPQFLAGNRSVFIPVIIAIILILIGSNSRLVRPATLAVFLPALFVVGIIAPRLWRDSLSRGGTIATAVTQAFDPQTAIGSFVGGLDTAMIDAFEIQIATQASGGLQQTFGSTYLQAALSFVPRELWDNKPRPVDFILNEALFPETHAKGIGFAFGSYSEPYLNFGLAGVLLASLLFGIALGWITSIANQKSTDLSFFLFCMAVAFIFPLMRGSFSFDIQRLLVPLLPVAFFVWLSTKIRPREERFMAQR
jgi:hypothetical protein